MQYAIELEGVRKKLGSFNLGPITLSVPKGYIVGYIGENGAGKSTTIKLLLGLMKAYEGKIKLLGEDIRQISNEKKKEIGYVFDDLFLPQDMNLTSIQKFHQKLYGNAWDDSVFRQHVSRFNLPDKKTIKHYSRGMKMQLGLALALSHGSKLLLLDEATSGLDPVIRDNVLDLLLEYIQDDNNTVLVSSHILSDLEKAADYIAFIHKGQLLFMEAKDQLVEEHGIVTLSKEQLNEIDPKAIVGVREHRFGVEALVKRNLIPKSFEAEKITIEDIMVYMIKGEQK